MSQVDLLASLSALLDQPLVDDALERADIDDLVQRKFEFDSQLDEIEREFDWLAFANEREFENWSEIADFASNPALYADIAEAEEVRDKVELLKGVQTENEGTVLMRHELS